MTTDLELSIVVPVFNGAKTVGPLVRELQQLSVDGGHEIVLVNDGSSDDSYRVCSSLVDTALIPVTFVEHTRNFGEHSAVLSGLRRARGRYVVTMDDDLQNPPSEVIRLYLRARELEVDVVYGYFETKNHARWRNLGSWFANKTANLVLDKPSEIYLSTFRCLRRWVAEEASRYEGAYPYVDGLILQVTNKVSSLAVKHRPSEARESNYTGPRLLALWSNVFLNFSVAPLRIATLMGLGMSAIGFLGGIQVVFEYLFLHTTVPGWASLMFGAFVFSGVQLLLLGLVGEYVGRVFLTVNRKPQSVVREVKTAELPSTSR